jgi:small subunit ribosomal protein S7
MRKGQATKRKILADPIYGSTTIAKAINMLMYDGKKGLAQDTFYTALSAAAKKLNQEPLDVFNKALENIGPAIELKVRRVAGSNYQVPTEVAPERKVTLALR